MSGVQLGLKKYLLGKKKEEKKQAEAAIMCLNKQKLLSNSQTKKGSINVNQNWRPRKQMRFHYFNY